MVSYSPVRSVERALDVLLALNRSSTSTLEQLFQQTQIPKPTLVRMLETLQSKGIVVHAPQRGAYSLASGVKALSSGYHGEPRLVEAAAPLAEAFTKKIKWPLALAVHDYDAVVVRYSTIPNSPLALLHSTMHMRLSLASRALGRAYLAFCTTEERRALLDILASSSHAEDGIATNRKEFEKTLSEIRKQGYALRAPGVRPVSGTLAVPVFEKRRVAASIGLTWFSSTLTEVRAVSNYLAPLQHLSKQISERLKQL